MDPKKSSYTVMSGSVSQLKYWLGASLNSNSNHDQNEEGGPGGTYLSYNLFLVLSVLGGFFALDHLYLRSPLTFLAKFIINFLFFGIWWLYDALHAIFSTDIIKVFGLSVPGLGPQGIAGGVLSKDVPDKLHYRFFIYAVALLFGGMFGIDSFLLGDNQSGFIRLVSTITVIFAPIAMIWWAYKLFFFFTDTSGVIQENHEYFGAPEISLQSQLTSKYPFLSVLFSPLSFFTKIFSSVVKPVIAPLQATVDTATGAVRNTITGTTGAVQKTAEAVRNTVQLGKNTVEKSAELAGQISNTIVKTGEALATASSALPGTSLYSSITPEGLKEGLASLQKGGSEDNLNVLPYALLGTLAVIAVSGFVTTYKRAKNVPSRDDTPPEPGVLRESDSKKRSA